MTDKPILFSGPMIRALLDGRKTQTRRIIKVGGRLPEFCGPRSCTDDPMCWGWEDAEHGDWVTLETEPGQRLGWRDTTAAHRPGDRLWVRETWNAFDFSQDGDEAWPCARIPTQKEIADIADQGCRVSPPQIVHRESERARKWFVNQKWRPGIHMPRWASRLTLTVTDVRVERLQAISARGCCAEGVMTLHPNGDVAPRPAFASLWDSINGVGAWDSNPWVAAYSFTVERRNIDAKEAA